MIIITIISIDFAIFPEHRELIENIGGQEAFVNLESGLLITFVVCMIGNIIPVPTPYSWVVCFGSAPFFYLGVHIPILVAFVAALGCLIGELGGYFIGRGAAEFIDIESKETLSGLSKYIVAHPTAAPIAIFIFGLTPLNDDFLTVPLGLVKYSATKTIFFIWLGKFGMMLYMAFNLLGLCGLIGGENWLLSIASIYGIIIMIYLFVRVDILKLIQRKDKIKE